MGSCRYSLKYFFNVNNHLVPLKVIVFFVYAGIFSLLPFLKEHSKYVGLTLQEKTIIYAALLLASSLGVPILGLLADNFRHFKKVLSSVLFLTLLSYNFLLAIPESSVEKQPADISFLFSESGGYLFTKSCNYPSLHCPLGEEVNNSHIGFQSCQIVCSDQNNSIPLPVTGNENSSTLIPEIDSQLCFQKTEQFPSVGHRYCKPFDRLITTSFENFTLLSAPNVYANKDECIYKTMYAVWEEEILYNPNCKISHPKCRITCDISIREINGSSYTCQMLKGDPITTYYSYIILRLICMILTGASVGLIEVAILLKVRTHEAEYGKQRVWGFLAEAVFIPLAGYFISLAETSDQPSYFPSFLIFDFFFLGAIILIICTLSIEMESLNCKPIMTQDTEFRHRWKTLFLFTSIFLLGIFEVFSKTYLADFLTTDISEGDLEMIGIIGRFACVPIIFFADSILDKIGRATVIITAFISISVQLLCHAFVRDSSLSLALEVLRYITSSLVIAASLTLADEIAHKKLFATTIALVYSTQHYLGGSIGLFISGFISNEFGILVNIREFGIVSCIIGIFCGLIYFIMKMCLLCQKDNEDIPLALAHLDYYNKPVGLDTKISKVDPALWNLEPETNSSTKITYQRIHA